MPINMDPGRTLINCWDFRKFVDGSVGQRPKLLIAFAELLACPSCAESIVAHEFQYKLA